MQQLIFLSVFSLENIKKPERKKMKSLKYFTTAILCLGISVYASGQWYKTVYGNGDVVKKDRDAELFTGVKVSTGIDVFLSQGDKMSISVEADENLHEYIITEVKDGVLHVYSDANIRKAKMKRVYVTMKDIDYLSTSSAGDIIGQTPVKTNDLKLNSSSAGDIRLEAYAKNVQFDISSSGDMTLSGEADVLSGDLSSAGDLNAYDFKVREADIDVSSAGDADIYVTERLRAHASSAGDVNYKGNPKYVDVHSSSAGGIHNR
jgi:Putative auto-transporter adhesin, head GIN domain